MELCQNPAKNGGNNESRALFLKIALKYRISAQNSPEDHLYTN